ncbi:MAG: BadF/BadG/BcrA/BcrD ATPase family protein, partial [Gemmataceae bacterium]
IVRTVTQLEAVAAAELLRGCHGEVKTAIVAHQLRIPPEEACARLQQAGGRIRRTIQAVPTARTTSLATAPDLVIGVDGGGTSTTAILADAVTGRVLGRGTAGPSNIQSVGVAAGLEALEKSIERAFVAADRPRAKVGAACLGLAGIDRQEGHDIIQNWAGRFELCTTLRVANDATLLLAAGTPAGWGLAVIAGTGSIAFVRTPDGQVGRCGGWGHTLGDEGSAYMIALAGLRAACRSHDQIAPATTLVPKFLERMNLAAPPDLIPAIYRGPWDRSAIAGLAPIVFSAATEGDGVAQGILTDEATALAMTAAAAVRNHGLPRDCPLALTGGVFQHSPIYRTAFESALERLGLQPTPRELVTDPAQGAVILARGGRR